MLFAIIIQVQVAAKFGFQTLFNTRRQKEQNKKKLLRILIGFNADPDSAF
jgi:hypothetical protein